MSMIERVARALCIKHGNDPDRLEPGNVCGDWEGSDGEIDGGPAHWVWRHYVPDARAAIEAMREPDDVVLEAVLKAVKDELYSEGIGHLDVERGAEVRIFAAMIDAALEETTK